MTRGLVLGGGGVRGIAHIGVLEVLEEEQIEIDYISGNSAGAIIGALYAAGYSTNKIFSIVMETTPYKLFDFPQLKTLTSLLGGKKLTTFLESQLGDIRFEDLDIPLVVNAVDINTGEIVYIDEGSVVEAVRASVSIPGVFKPVKRGSAFLVDAGFLDPVPLEGLPECDSYICIDVSSVNTHIDENSSFNQVFRRFVHLIQQKNMSSHLTMQENLTLIQPDTSEWLLLDMRNYEDLRKRGREAIEEKINSEI